MLRLGGQTNATCWIDVGSNVASNVALVWPPLKNKMNHNIYWKCNTYTAKHRFFELYKDRENSSKNRRFRIISCSGSVFDSINKSWKMALLARVIKVTPSVASRHFLWRIL